MKDECFILHPSAFSLRSLPYLPFPIHHVLVCRQFFQPAGAASMEFVGADANFGPQTEFITVVESRAGVDHDGRAIDALRELAGGPQVLRHDRIGVLRAVMIDVLNRLGQRIDDLYGNNWPEKLRSI